MIASATSFPDLGCSLAANPGKSPDSSLQSLESGDYRRQNLGASVLHVRC